MKKIILGLGTFGAVVAPITTVIACDGNNGGSTPAIDKGELAKNSKLFFEAFNNTTGGQNVSKYAKYINDKYTEILVEKDKVKKANDLKEYIAIIAKEIAAINYSDDPVNINKYNVGTSKEASDELGAIFNAIHDAIDPKIINTDAKAKAAGFDDLAQVTKAWSELEKGPNNISIASQEINSTDDTIRKNSITISETISDLSGFAMSPFYKMAKADIKKELGKLFMTWDLINSNKPIDINVLRRFVSEVGNKLNSIAPDKAIELNKFVSTTPSYIVNKWKKMWSEIENITSLYENEYEAKFNGFKTNAIAKTISGKFALLKNVLVSSDTSGDVNAITIYGESDNELEKYSRELFGAFDKTVIGGRDVSKQYSYIVNHYKGLQLDPTLDKIKEFLLPFVTAIIGTGYENSTDLNKINPFFYPDEAKYWNEMLDFAIAKLSAIDSDAMAREWGFESKIIVRNANSSVNLLKEISIAPHSKPYDDSFKNSIIICKGPKDDLDKIILPFANQKSMDATKAWKVFSLNYEFSKTSPDTLMHLMFIQIGQALLRYDNAHPNVDPKLLLDASTTKSDFDIWKQMFRVVNDITGNFDNDNDAQKFGFADNATAKKIAAVANKFLAITKATQGADSTLTIS